MRHPLESRVMRAAAPSSPIEPPRRPVPLEILYARHESMAEGRAPGDSTDVHLAILDRLASNRRLAEAEGWTACALQRVAGMGQLRLWGVPPDGEVRAVVPDGTLPKRAMTINPDPDTTAARAHRDGDLT